MYVEVSIYTRIFIYAHIYINGTVKRKSFYLSELTYVPPEAGHFRRRRVRHRSGKITTR